MRGPLVARGPSVFVVETGIAQRAVEGTQGFRARTVGPGNLIGDGIELLAQAAAAESLRPRPGLVHGHAGLAPAAKASERRGASEPGPGFEGVEIAQLLADGRE